MKQNLNNETLIQLLGITGPAKCSAFAEIDGPDTEDIIRICEKATNNDEMIVLANLISNCHGLLDTDLAKFQEVVNNYVVERLGENALTYNVYKLLLEIAQQSGRSDCEIVLITDVIGDLSTQHSNEDNPIGVKFICFDSNGNLYKKVDKNKVLIEQTLDSPLTVLLPSFVNMVERFNKDIEKSVAHSSDIISFELADEDAEEKAIEYTSGEAKFEAPVQDISSMFTSNTSVHIDDDSSPLKDSTVQINIKKNEPTNNTNGSLKSDIIISNKDITLTKKSAAVILSAALAIGVAGFGFGFTSSDKEVKEKNKLLNEAANKLISYKFIETKLQEDPTAGKALTELSDIHAAIDSANLKFEPERKALILKDGSNSANIENK